MTEQALPNLDLIAQYYDLLYAEQTDDLPLWLSLAEAGGGPVLELGCGTGRVLLPLAQAGHAVTGLELSTAALQAAQTKLRVLGPEAGVTLVQADMRQFALARRDFALALIPTNTLMHCLTTADQLACLRAVHDHLRPGGRVAIDLFHPDPQTLLEGDGRLYYAGELVDEASGRRVHWSYSRQVQLDVQIQETTFLLDEIDEAGLVRRAALTFPLRYVHRYELELLLVAAGFEAVDLYGDYDLSPFRADSPRIILIAERCS